MHTTEIDTKTQHKSPSERISEWVEGSAISPELTQKWLEHESDPMALAQLLHWKSYEHTPGWYVRSCDPITGKRTNSGQFKPDLPLLFPDSDRPQKYLSFPKGKASEAIYPVMTLNEWIKISEAVGVSIEAEDLDETRDDLGFWLWVKNHPEIPIVITEGAKKAACLLSHQYIALALSGVWNGQQKKGKKLHPSLEPLIVPGRPVYLAFDADVVIKENVSAALRQLGRLCKARKAEVFIVTWDLELGKGCDDLIVKQGVSAWQAAIDNSMPYSEWLKALEKQFTSAFGSKTDASSSKQTQKVPPADILAREIAEAYRSQLCYNNESKTWMRYQADSPGCWSPETDEFIESIISDLIDGMGIAGYGSNSYIVNVVKKIRHKLIKRKWVERPATELLPFLNGVLEIKTGKLLPHAPGYGFTWCLPRNYQPHATDWSQIESFFDYATKGNQSLKQILLCFASAVLKGRADLQKFLLLIGNGGTGKGTYFRLLTDLIGEGNVLSTTLQDWCGNRFEAANAYQKRLILFWDEDKQIGNLGKFKSLTGGDWLRGEEKGKKAFPFRFDGMVALSANFPIFAGDSSSGMSRRMLTVPMKNAPKPGQRRNLNQEWEKELAAFTNYVLSIPDEEVTRTLLQLEPLPEIDLEFWEGRIRTDSIAAWLNERVIRDCLAQTAIGSDRYEAEKQDPVSLYGSYCLWCRQNGTQPKSNKNFSPDLLELCRNILNWTEVEKIVTKTGKYIRGLRLRTNFDEESPTFDYQLQQLVNQNSACRSGNSESNSALIPNSDDGSGDGSGDGLELSQDKAFNDGDGLNVNPTENPIESDCFSSAPLPKDVEEETKTQFDQPGTTSGPPLAKSSRGKGFDLSPHPSPLPSPREKGDGFPLQVTESQLIGKRIRSQVTGRVGVVSELRLGEYIPVLIIVNFDGDPPHCIVPLQPEKLVFEDGKPFPTFTVAENVIFSDQNWEPDWTSYPHLTSRELRAAQNRANQIRSAMLEAVTAEELQRLSGEYTRDEVVWVWKRLLNQEEKRLIKSVFQAKQLSLW